jgi:hypothetical protein
LCQFEVTHTLIPELCGRLQTLPAKCKPLGRVN